MPPAKSKQGSITGGRVMSAVRCNRILAMAVGDRVREAIDKLNQGDPVNALIQVCIAIDATSKKEFTGKLGKKQSHRYKAFLKKHQAFITRVSTGKLEIAGPILFTISGPGRPIKCRTLEEILYNLIRCALVHEGSLPNQVQITNENVMGVTSDGKVLISINLIRALIMAVACSDVNRDQRVPEGYSIGIENTRIDLNNLWGRKDLVYRLTVEYNRP